MSEVEATTSRLGRVHTGKKLRPRGFVIHGAHGIGKSTFCSQGSKPIILCCEAGVNDLDVASLPGEVDRYGSYVEFEEDLMAVATESHDYRTVVIDSIDWLEKLIFNRVCQEHAVDSIAEIPYGKGYQYAGDKWMDVISLLDSCKEAGFMVGLIAHSRIEKFESPETDNYDRYTLALHKIANAIICEWADEIFWAGYKVHTRESDEGFGRSTTKAISSGERIIRTVEKPFCVAKNRCGLPDEMPLSFQSYIDGIKACQS